MNNKIIGLAIIGAGGIFLLSRRADAAGFSDDDFNPIDPATGMPVNTSNLTPAQRVALQQYAAHAGPGNAPIVASPSMIGPVTGLVGAAGSTIAIATIGTATVGAAIATAAVTAGIGLVVIFVSYKLLKQRASMHVNDVRDQWQRQFVDLHRALGIRPLTAAQTFGSGPGNIEMAEVIFHFDHDSSQRLWMAVTHTQNEQAFRTAAANIDRFLSAQGVPVQDV